MQPPVSRDRFARSGSVIAFALLVAGCTTTEGQQQLSTDLADLQVRLESVSAELSATRRELASRDAAADSTNAALAERVAGLSTQVEQLPEELASLCPAVPVAAVAVAERCEPTVEVRTVTVNSDKLVVGELERVLIDPPGATIVARIDTGADSSSLHAAEMVEFERDGQRWVRFSVKLDNGVATLERPIKRFVRVVQQADPEGSRRPVVDLRLRLGNVRETVDFTLADRSHLNNEMLLGRNFLTDVALVDVGKQFVQPPVQDAGKDQ